MNTKRDHDTDTIFRKRDLAERKAAYFERTKEYLARQKTEDKKRRARMKRLAHLEYSLHKQATRRGIEIDPEKEGWGTWWIEDRHKPLCELFRMQLLKQLTREYRKTHPLRIQDVRPYNIRHNRDILHHIVAKTLLISGRESKIICRAYEEAMEEVLFSCGYITFHNFGRLFLEINNAKFVHSSNGMINPVYNKIKLRFKVCKKLNRARLRMLEISRKVHEMEKEMRIEIEAMDAYTLHRKLTREIPI